jgi:hypothetical protein
VRKWLTFGEAHGEGGGVSEEVSESEGCVGANLREGEEGGGTKRFSILRQNDGEEGIKKRV